SHSVADALTGPGQCGSGTPVAGEQGRCGYGPRMPLLVISPFAKRNSVDHTLTDQSSILRGIQDNWGLPRIAGSMDSRAGSIQRMFDFTIRNGSAVNAAPFLLDPTTGQPARR
ncbi:MAG: phosphoesterase, partial [Mycobacterium sp.]|nr:phosphoesterase [Mycobacterium sp.]